MKRITIRLNDVELAELVKFKVAWNIKDDSKALKVGVEWVNHYIENVTKAFFPPNYDIHLMRKSKSSKMQRMVWDEKFEQ